MADKPFRTIDLFSAETVPVVDGQLEWLPLRRRLGGKAFGTNAYRAAQAGDLVIEDHVESPGQEEMYVVIRGGVRFTVDGEDVDGPAGTALYLPDPKVRRSGVAVEDETVVLAVGGWPDKPYRSLPWEPIFLAEDAMRRGDWAAAAETIEREAEHQREYPRVRYRLAYCLARAGERERAREELRAAVAAAPDLRERAADEEAFAGLDLTSPAVDLVRSICAAWEQGRFGDTSWAHPEIEYEIVDGPAPGSWKGVPQMRQAWTDFLAAWEEVRISVSEYVELDNERILVTFTRQIRGRTSGLELETAGGASLFDIRDGKVARLKVFLEGVPEIAELGSGPVEVVRRVLSGWERGDFAADPELLDPHLRFETFMPDADENVVANGLAELAAFTRDWLAQWRDYRVAAEDIQAVGPEKVFAALEQRAEGRHSGVEVASPGFSVWTVREGRVTALSLYYDRSEALASAGL